MSASSPVALPESIPPRPSDLRLALLIARRAAFESLRDRTSLLMSVFFSLLLPIFMVITVIRPLAAPSPDPKQSAARGIVMAVYLLLVGTLPSSAAVGIAAGQFAGENAQGSLAPLLASPASNSAIFGGKVLGAIIPAILFSAVAEFGYLVELAIVVGPEKLRLLPPALSFAMLALVPGFALFGATVSSLISSRVRTFNAAQQIGGLVLLPIMFGLFGLAFKLPDWGPLTLVFAVLGILLADLALLILSAVTWRREEVLARR